MLHRHANKHTHKLGEGVELRPFVPNHICSSSFCCMFSKKKKLEKNCFLTQLQVFIFFFFLISIEIPVVLVEDIPAHGRWLELDDL